MPDQSEHRHMNCSELLDSLSDYIDGTLEKQSLEEMKLHLCSCPNCKIVVDTINKTIALYQANSNETIQVPAPILERLHKVLGL